MLGSYLELVKTPMTASRTSSVRDSAGGAPDHVVLPWLPPPRPGGLVGVHDHGRDAGWRAWICPGFSKCGAWVTTARHGWRRRSRPPRPGVHGREAAWLVRRRREHGCTHTRPGEHGQRRRCGCWASGAAFVSRCVEGRGGRRVWVGFGLGLGPGLMFHFRQGTVDLHRTTESVPRCMSICGSDFFSWTRHTRAA
jgi:hypothetical protein